MNFHKSEVLRITNTIYNIEINTIVEITCESEKFILKCKCIDDMCELYDLNNDNITWGLNNTSPDDFKIHHDSLNDLRDSLLRDFLNGIITDVKIITNLEDVNV